MSTIARCSLVLLLLSGIGGCQHARGSGPPGHTPEPVSRVLGRDTPDDRYHLEFAARCRGPKPRPIRCYRPGDGKFTVAGVTLLARRLETHNEHEGRHGGHQSIRLTLPDGRFVAQLTQSTHQVDDDMADLFRQGVRIHDLDGDGRTELCVESKPSVGPGLFSGELTLIQVHGRAEPTLWESP